MEDNLIVGPPQVVKDKGKKLAKEITIEDIGEVKEFIGCMIKIVKLDQSAKFTQPVMIQSFLDEFGTGKKRLMPAELNSVLKRLKSGKILANKNQSKYWSGIRKMMHMMRLPRPDIYNATLNCARHMLLAGRTHYDAMVPIMDDCVTTPERGLVLYPHGDWDGISMDYKFEVMVKTDSIYAKCPDTRRSITGSVVYLNGVLDMFISSTQKTVHLSTTKVEMNAAVMGVQDVLFMKNILKSLGLKVKLPIQASIDNGRAIDIGNNWSVDARTHHVEVKQNFLWEWKEASIVKFQWISTASNEADMFTKNLVGPEHNKHAARLCGNNK